MNTVSAPRIIFIGDSGVGKTSIIHRAKNGNFESQTVPTIGAGTTIMHKKINGKKIEYQIWDTAGQEIYRNIVPIYFKGAIGAVVAFSVLDPVSFQSLQSWIDMIYSHVGKEIGIVIIGNKIDSSDHEIDESYASKWAKERSLPIYFTSAKTGQNIDVLFDHIENSFIGKEQSIEMIKATQRNSDQCC